MIEAVTQLTLDNFGHKIRNQRPWLDDTTKPEVRFSNFFARFSDFFARFSAFFLFCQFLRLLRKKAINFVKTSLCTYPLKPGPELGNPEFQWNSEF